MNIQGGQGGSIKSLPGDILEEETPETIHLMAEIIWNMDLDQILLNSVGGCS